METLAARVHMSPRTFARRFRAEAGATPHDWLTSQRVLLARRLLEETELGVDAVATRCGFGDAATLRHHFARRVGATPQSYRTTFRRRDATPASQRDAGSQHDTGSQLASSRGRSRRRGARSRPRSRRPGCRQIACP